MKLKVSIFFLFITMGAGAQTQLTMEGKSYVNSEDTWLGVNIPRSVQTRLIFRNNIITSVNRFGYMLQAGDESPATTNNNLDGAVITGNKFNWSGSDMKVIPHGLFTGHNKNVVAKYNYLSYVPMGIIRKSGNNMTNTEGGVAYNIVKSGAVAMVVKGMSNVNIFNNTFYTDRTESQTWRPLVNIYTNTDGGRYSVAHGTKIYNNIFYTKYQTYAISVDDAESLTGLECDYNVYWCENGTPRFNINGSVKTFAQWQAMGYDLHSVVMNPGFKDLVNFVPSKRLDFGKDLGAEWKDGLAVNARWGTADPATTAQNGKWQVGAVVYASETVTTPPAPDQTEVKNDAEKITVNPNPASGYIRISMTNAKPSVERKLKIFDLSGKLCIDMKLAAEQEQSIAIDLTKGVYIVQIITGDVIQHVQKLIVVG
jgi:hypothetical protein